MRVKATGKLYGFYGPYLLQKPIESTLSGGQQYEFTIATADLGHSNNWVVCKLKLVKTLKSRCNSTPRPESGKALQHSSEIEIEVLRKVGVLRTDFCGEILASTEAGTGALRKIHALFV